MTDFSYHFLNLVGVPCIKWGSSLVSAPDFAKGIPQGAKFAVEIADACSGIRSLFALVMITALYANLTLRKAWQQWTLFALAMPLAVLGNFARILMLTFGTLIFGNAFAIGTEKEPSSFHLGAGFFVYVVALIGMHLMGTFLQSKDSVRAEKKS
jgi:exosortase